MSLFQPQQTRKKRGNPIQIIRKDLGSKGFPCFLQLLYYNILSLKESIYSDDGLGRNGMQSLSVFLSLLVHEVTFSPPSSSLQSFDPTKEKVNLSEFLPRD